jgi:uncharacterized membrane protein YecN with MAPEG domain
MVAFTMYVSETWALVAGVLFIVGRQIYYMMYVKNPDSRSVGMVISFFSNLALLIGAIIALTLGILS